MQLIMPKLYLLTYYCSDYYCLYIMWVWVKKRFFFLNTHSDSICSCILNLQKSKKSLIFCVFVVVQQTIQIVFDICDSIVFDASYAPVHLWCQLYIFFEEYTVFYSHVCIHKIVFVQLLDKLFGCCYIVESWHILTYSHIKYI
jgi:hypothetical protein